jgi:hypothetical protein
MTNLRFHLDTTSFRLFNFSVQTHGRKDLKLAHFRLEEGCAPYSVGFYPDSDETCDLINVFVPVPKFSIPSSLGPFLLIYCFCHSP